MVEIAGSNPAETIESLLPWPSGDGTWPTSRRSQVRVLPGVLRSGLEPGSQHGLISRTTSVQIRPPQLKGGACTKGARLARNQSGRVRFPSSPISGRRIAGPIRLLWEQEIAGSTPAVLTYGPVVQREDVSLACWQCGFDSRRVHSIRRAAGYGWPGRSAKAVLLPGDEGSTPSPSACLPWW